MSVYSSQPKNKQELEKQLTLLGDILEEHIEQAMTFESADPRSLQLAKNNLQMGFMWFRRGLENSDKF